MSEEGQWPNELRVAKGSRPGSRDPLRDADLTSAEPATKLAQCGGDLRTRVGRRTRLGPDSTHVQDARLAVDDRLDATDETLATEDRQT